MRVIVQFIYHFQEFVAKKLRRTLSTLKMVTHYC